MDKRLKYIDNARGILILLVLLAHCFGLDDRLRIIYVSHVPGFFLISGLLFRFSSSLKKSISANIVTIFKRFIIPFLFFEIIGGLAKVISKEESFYESIINIVTLRYNTGANWYIVSLAVAEILFIFMKKHIRHHSLFIIIAILISVPPFIIPKTHVMLTIGRICVAFVFLTLGYYLFPFFDRCKHKLSISVFSICIASVLTYTNEIIDVYPLRLGNPIVFFVSSLCSAFFILSICQLRFFDIFSFLGRLSLPIMGVHQSVLLFLKCHVFIKFPLVVIISTIIAYVLNRFAPFLLGNRNVSLSKNRHLSK